MLNVLKAHVQRVHGPGRTAPQSGPYYHQGTMWRRNDRWQMWSQQNAQQGRGVRAPPVVNYRPIGALPGSTGPPIPTAGNMPRRWTGNDMLKGGIPTASPAYGLRAIRMPGLDRFLRGVPPHAYGQKQRRKLVNVCLITLITLVVVGAIVSLVAAFTRVGTVEVTVEVILGLSVPAGQDPPTGEQVCAGMEEVVSGADGLTLEDCNAEVILDSARRRRRNILYEMNMRSPSRRKRQTDEATTAMARVEMTVSADPDTVAAEASDSGSGTLNPEELVEAKFYSDFGQAVASGGVEIEGSQVQSAVSAENPDAHSYEATTESPQQVDYYVTFTVTDETEVRGEDVCDEVVADLGDPPPVCEVYYSDTGRLVLQVTAATSDADAYEDDVRSAANGLDVPGLDMGTTNVARIAPPTPAPDDPTTTPADEDTTGDE